MPQTASFDLEAEMAARAQHYPALRRPLKFGDPEQIEALEQLRRSVEEDAEIARLAKLGDGDPVPEGCRKFRVTIEETITREETITVYARDQEQAYEVADRVLDEEFDDAEIIAVEEARDK